MTSRPAKNQNLHGNVPDSSQAALILIDVITDLDFPRNEHLIESVPALAKSIGKLKARCRAAGIPTIYVNDNFKKWRSDFPAILNHCLLESCPGKPLAEQLAPGPDDYIVLKAKH